jgi:uncharacterized spore protein YtfJ
MELDSLMARAGEAVSVGRAFGTPIDHDGVLVIPVAWVAGGGGGGSDNSEPEKSQSGGGFGGFTWPLGVYVVKDGTVSWMPAIDATRILLAGIRLVAAILSVVTVGKKRSRRGSTVQRRPARPSARSEHVA